jgi:DNA-binding NtrC family response regulator
MYNMDDRKRILLVDDDRWVLFVLLQSLLALGTRYEIVTARDGREALDRASEAPFDLVITDLAMPAPNGVQLTESIRCMSPRTVFVWITAYSAASILPESARLSVYRTLEKPLEVADIRRVAQQALAQADLQSAPGQAD